MARAITQVADVKGTNRRPRVDGAMGAGEVVRASPHPQIAGSCRLSPVQNWRPRPSFSTHSGSNRGRTLVPPQSMRLGATHHCCAAWREEEKQFGGTMNLAQTASLCILIAGTGVTSE